MEKKIFKNRWCPYIWLIFIGFLIYAKTLFFNFTFLDDHTLILENQYFLKNLANIITSFKQDVFHTYFQVYYRPLLTISFILDAQIGGASPFIYHLGNIIIHLLASCLLFLFLKKLRLKKELSFFFALIFTVHPVLTQAVAWIPGRNDSLLALFVLASFIFLIDYIKNPNWKNYFLNLIFFALSLFTKETAIVLILIYLFYLHFLTKEKLFSLNEKLLGMGWGALTIFWFLSRRITLRNPLNILPQDMFKSFFLNLPVILQSLGKIFLPFNLSVLPIIKDTSFIYGIISLSFLVTIFSLSKNKKSPLIIFGLLWFFLFFLPLLPLHNPALAFGDDYQLEHRLYLPLIGLIIFLSDLDLIRNLNFKKGKTLIVSGGILSILAILTFIHEDNFKDRMGFWQNAVKTSPHFSLAHRNLGAIYFLDKNFERGEIEFKKALELNPNEPMANMNLGLVYMNQNKFRQAEEYFKKEIEINPTYDNAYFNFGLLRLQQQREGEAIKLWQKTIEINPNFIDAYKALAAFYYQQKELDKAKIYLDELLKRGISPTFIKGDLPAGRQVKGDFLA